MAEAYDIIIVGGGIVGCMVARYLSRYKLDVLLIEKEADVCTGASAANTAIVHAGYDPMPGSLKAKLNVAGNAMWDTLAGELNFAFDRRGDYVVAIGDEELAHLQCLLEQGKKNGVPGIHIISGEEMRNREPEINPSVSGALWAPTGGICDPFGVTIAAAENAIQNGVKVYLETAFEAFIMDGKRIIGVRTNRGDFYCRWVINAAGLYADMVMHKAGIYPEFVIKPRRGEYCVLDQADITVRNVLFPVPSKASKGIMVTATVHGNALVGPNSNFIEDKDDCSVTRAGLDEIWHGARKLIPSLDTRHVIAMYAGLRACGNAPCRTPGVDYRQDFIVEVAEEVSGLINLAGIESPGLTSAPAIALRVVEMLLEAGERLEEKKDWQPIRPPRPRFRHLPREEQLRLIREDSRYGRIICRCEMVTEGEIVAEIHAPIPAKTYDAIKRRTWLGTGRCQGSFDMPRVVDILSRELGMSPFEISKRGGSSRFLLCTTKEVNHED
ncbi:MAG: NAD(P)/FAD-dependent oxidoreductase [Anaerolineae bacterium]|nr:NAD(P)/FAD-dependent oxidoreductase [Anaerolineae bacterium]